MAPTSRVSMDRTGSTQHRARPLHPSSKSLPSSPLGLPYRLSSRSVLATDREKVGRRGRQMGDAGRTEGAFTQARYGWLVVSRPQGEDGGAQGSLR